MHIVCSSWSRADLSERRDDRGKGSSVGVKHLGCGTPSKDVTYIHQISRLILADTKELHERIADLEKALAVAHAKTTTEPHNLLTNTYLYSPRDPNTSKGSTGRKGKLTSRLAGSSKIRRRGRNEDEDGDDSGLTDDESGEISLGTLTIGANGEAQFVGASAGSSLLHVSSSDLPTP